MKNTGELLKKAREEKGLTLHEVGLSLKINSKTLKAIEDGDEAHLPAKTFLRGFVLSYANYLHLDSNMVMASFYAEVGSTKPQPYIRPGLEEKPKEGETSAPAIPAPKITTATAEAAAPIPVKKVPAKGKSDSIQALDGDKNAKSVLIFSLGIALVVLIIFTKKMIDKYSKEAEVASGVIAEMMEGATPVTQETEPANKQTQTNLNPVTSDLLSPLNQLGNFTGGFATPNPKATPTNSPSPSPSVAATTNTTVTTTTVASAEIKPAPTPTPSLTPTPQPTPTPSPTASATPKPESGRPVELIVEALDSVEIEYSSQTGKSQKIRLSAEQVHTFKSRSGLKISFSNGGAVNLIVNGKEVGIPGDLGKSINLSY